MKKSIFIKAWDLFRNLKISFSEALKQAWKTIKEEMAFLTFSPDSVYENISWNGNKVLTYQKDNCRAGSIERLFEIWYCQKPLNNDGAASCYDGKTYNAD